MGNLGIFPLVKNGFLPLSWLFVFIKSLPVQNGGRQAATQETTYFSFNSGKRHCLLPHIYTLTKCDLLV